MMCAIFHAAVDDTQRMMQMGGGFGFDPSKVQILVVYCIPFINLNIDLGNYSCVPWIVAPLVFLYHKVICYQGWHAVKIEHLVLREAQCRCILPSSV